MAERYTVKEQEYQTRLIKNMTEFGKEQIFSIGHAIENLSTEKPNKPALFFENLSWTWEEFNSECNLYSNFFHNLGLEHQECVAVILENCPEYLFITTGINKIQGISALINTNQRKDGLIHALDVADPKFIVVDGKHVKFLEEIYERVGVKEDRIFVINNNEKIHHKFTEMDSNFHKTSRKNPASTKNSKFTELCFLIYTSGTTGLPKAAKMNNGVISTGLINASICNLNSDDVLYIITPLYHSLGMALVWSCVVYLKGTAVLKRRFSTSNFWSDIQKYKVTFLGMIGEIPRFLLNQPISPLENNHTLKKVLSLGLKKNIWMNFKNRFQIEHIFEIYAATEAYGPFINVDEIPGMVGRLDFFKGEGNHLLLKVDPDTHELIQEEDGSYQSCKPGDVGMVLNIIENPESYELYRSKSATQKKLLRGIILKDLDFENSEEISEKISKRVYLKSGDLFQLHENRWVSFADRLGDTFRWKGENVSTQEVENIIATHQSIKLCAVYGVSIPNTDGKAGMAAVVVESSHKFDKSSILEFLNTSLPKYSIPIFIRLCEDLSLTGSFKMKKVKLRNEGFNIEKLNDDIFFLDPNQRKYISLTGDIYKELCNGTYKI